MWSHDHIGRPHSRPCEGQKRKPDRSDRAPVGTWDWPSPDGQQIVSGVNRFGQDAIGFIKQISDRRFVANLINQRFQLLNSAGPETVSGEQFTNWVSKVASANDKPIDFVAAILSWIHGAIVQD